jgi:2-polyprenyl-3-methyl-5-hydroxy-6-metoxy-1,4-benzoquinol methylase
MREDKLFKGPVADVSTEEFHRERERADHWSQGHQRPRMEMALRFIRIAVESSPVTYPKLSDLGCGDGGMLAQVQAQFPEMECWGYDFQPSNVRAAVEERGLNVQEMDVFNTYPFSEHGDRKSGIVRIGQIVVMTEVLEHLSNPHNALHRLHHQGKAEYIIASSPHGEHRDSHDACHAWAWDEEGYERIFRETGWSIARHEIVDWSQVILARRFRA